MQTLVIPQGEFQLARYPHRKNEALRAWDAADEYLLHYLHDEHLPAQAAKVLAINDHCGTLGTVLADHRPQSLTDSHLTHQATRANLERNNRSSDCVHLLDSLAVLTGPLDLVLCKIPKSLAFLEDLLHRIRPCLHQHTRLIGAAMTRDIHTSTLDLFTRIIGTTHTSLARKKARLIFSHFDALNDPGANPYPSRYTLEGSTYSLINHANVFSRSHLDLGTRLLLEQIPASTKRQTIVDLGCGNGVIGLVAATRNPQAEVIFVDESFMAIASAQANFTAALPERRGTFAIGDGLEHLAPSSVDLILCNPPFHQGQAVENATAWRMFRQARTALKKGGSLWIVANRHLDHHTKLRQLFNHCATVSSNRRFVVLRSKKR